jgi:hypothetical protein
MTWSLYYGETRVLGLLRDSDVDFLAAGIADFCTRGPGWFTVEPAAGVAGKSTRLFISPGVQLLLRED